MNVTKKIMNTLAPKLNFLRKNRKEGSNYPLKSKDIEALDKKLRPAKEYLEKVKIFEADLVQFSAIKELTSEVLSDIIKDLLSPLKSDDVLKSISEYQISRIANNSHKNLIINYIAVKTDNKFLDNFSNALLNVEKFKEHDTLILDEIKNHIKYQFDSLMKKCKKDEEIFLSLDHSSNSSLTSSNNSSNSLSNSLSNSSSNNSSNSLSNNSSNNSSNSSSNNSSNSSSNNSSNSSSNNSSNSSCFNSCFNSLKNSYLNSYNPFDTSSSGSSLTSSLKNFPGQN